MDLAVIRNFCEHRPGGMRKLASDIGMSEANLHRCVNNNKIQAADLEKIAMLLNVPIETFFDERCKSCLQNKVETHGAQSPASVYGNASVANNDNEVEYLKQLLAEKERTIQILMKK